MATDKPVNVLSTINSVYPSLYDAEKRVADYVLEQYTDVINMHITELSEKCDVSDATIVRFCKKLGLKGFHHFKIALAKEIVDPERSFSPTVTLDNIHDSINNIFMYKMEELKQTADFLDVETVRHCIDLIGKSHIVYFVAAGNSIPVALDAAYKFSQIGVRTIVNTSPEMQISSVSSLTERDIVIGISNSGNSKLLLHIFEIAKKRGAKTVCITSHIKSPLAQAADYQLNTVSNERLFFDGFSYNRIPSIAVIDVLFLLFSKRSVKDTYNYISDKEQLLSDYKF